MNMIWNVFKGFLDGARTWVMSNKFNTFASLLVVFTIVTAGDILFSLRSGNTPWIESVVTFSYNKMLAADDDPVFSNPYAGNAASVDEPAGKPRGYAAEKAVIDVVGDVSVGPADAVNSGTAVVAQENAVVASEAVGAAEIRLEAKTAAEIRLEAKTAAEIRLEAKTAADRYYRPAIVELTAERDGARAEIEMKDEAIFRMQETHAKEIVRIGAVFEKRYQRQKELRKEIQRDLQAALDVSNLVVETFEEKLHLALLGKHAAEAKLKLADSNIINGKYFSFIGKTLMISEVNSELESGGRSYRVEVLTEDKVALIYKNVPKILVDSVEGHDWIRTAPEEIYQVVGEKIVDGIVYKVYLSDGFVALI